jgi:hypothetical protein
MAAAAGQRDGGDDIERIGDEASEARATGSGRDIRVSCGGKRSGGNTLRSYNGKRSSGGDNHVERVGDEARGAHTTSNGVGVTRVDFSGEQSGGSGQRVTWGQAKRVAHADGDS